MKSIFTCIFVAFAACTTFTAAFAQTPQGFSYQAIANNANGTPVANGNVAVRISVLDNSATGTAVYTETHAKTTNAQGLFNLNIGQGTPTTGVFANINWAQNAKYVKVELDPAGGTNYTTVGTNQLMSVPYALYAEKSNVANNANTVSTGSGAGKNILLYTNNNAYVYHSYCSNCGSNMETQSISGGATIKAIADTSSILLYNNSNAYVYHSYCSNCGSNWETHSISGTPTLTAQIADAMLLCSGNNVYIYHSYCSNCGSNWETHSISGTPLGTITNKPK